MIEPYYGGSHRAFLTGLRRHVDFEFTLLSLPARKWKMRMQLAAPWMADQVMALTASGKRYDGMLCSTFLDLAVLRARLFSAGIDLPAAVYFHENQFSYPGYQGHIPGHKSEHITDPGRRQFTAINFTSALTADFTGFNSRYNLDTFLNGLQHCLNKATDMQAGYMVETVSQKADIIYPGMDFAALDRASKPSRSGGEPVIVWNHRWEHDKDPETFFKTLVKLAGKGLAFEVIVLGQHFKYQPDIFAWARKKLATRIRHWGYAHTREEYARMLACGDIVVSTARHEFFGMAVLEGVRAGCRPLVPDGLAYRELFPARYRYRRGQLERYLGELLVNYRPMDRTRSRQLTQPYAWPETAGAYERWLLKMTDRQRAR